MGVGNYMASVIDKIKWNLYKKKHHAVIKYGLMTGKVRPYDQETIERLRKVYYGGIAASVVVLCNDMCQGHCYDRGLLITLGFGDDDFQLVDADIDGITLNPDYVDEYRHGEDDEHYGNHCFAERKMSDGKTWVYDTTRGLMFEKNLYYFLERPKITKINSKQATLDFIDYQDIANADISKDKYASHLILPNIELIAKNTKHFYKDALLKEIEQYKQDIDYEAICREIKEDMEAHGLEYMDEFYEQLV